MLVKQEERGSRKVWQRPARGPGPWGQTNQWQQLVRTRKAPRGDVSLSRNLSRFPQRTEEGRKKVRSTGDLFSCQIINGVAGE